MDDAVFAGGTQASPVVAHALEEELIEFLAPFVEWLDTLLDKRLVRTLVSGILALVEWRNRAHGLLLSELGAYVRDPAHAPAGTKRLFQSAALTSVGGQRAEWVSLAPSDAAPCRTGNAQRDAAADLGYECAGETGESGLPRSGVRALQQGAPPDTSQARVLPSADTSAVCPRLALDWPTARGTERRKWPTVCCAHTLVNHAGSTRQRPRP